jgi:hypothetical protein
VSENFGASTAEWTHEDIKIWTRDDGLFYFVLDGDAQYRETLKAAKDAVEGFKNRKRASSKIKLSVPAIKDDGATYVITGVHASNGNVLTNPAESHGYDSLFIATETSKRLIADKLSLEKQIEAIDSKLAPYKLFGRYKEYGKHFDPARAAESIKAKYDSLLAKEQKEQDLRIGSVA